MNDFYESGYAKGLPGIVARKPWAQALSETELFFRKRLRVYVDKAKVYFHPENMTHEACDLLAVEMNVPNYDQTLDIDKKWKIILNAMSYQMQAGTKTAVERVVTDLYDEAVVKEWNEFGGEPYYFRISTTNADDDMRQKGRVIDAVNMTKPVRSWLESMEWVDRMKPEHDIFVGSAICGYHTTPMPVTDIRIGEVGVFDDFILDESAMT